MDRRAFVEASAALAAAILSGCASQLSTRVTPKDGMVRISARNFPELSRPSGGAVRILPDGAANPLYVVMLDSGEAVTLSPVCKHLGCIVDWKGREFVCPCHGSRYGPDGSLRRGPAQLPLDTFPTELGKDGVLVIDLRSTS